MAMRILVKTTISARADDWTIDRFALLTAHLRSLRDPRGTPRYVLTARNRLEDEHRNDVDLSEAARGGYEQLWLIANDETGALTAVDVENLTRFRDRGGGLLLTRDHQNLGACLARLGVLGATQFFQSVNPEPEASRQCCDDRETPSISWPNYHSGANGDLQPIRAVEPLHPLLATPGGEPLRHLPAHQHEGAVGVPRALEHRARVVAQGRSLSSGVTFNLCVAVEQPGRGRAVSDSSFHHFCDYNWNPDLGCPSFVTELPGRGVLRPGALDDTHRYVENIASWLAGES